MTVRGSASGLADPRTWSLNAYGSVVIGTDTGQLETAMNSGRPAVAPFAQTGFTVTATAREALTFDAGASLTPTPAPHER